MRPKIICQMTTTVDGRMLAERWSRPAAGIDEKVVRGHYDQIYEQFNPEGWIVGRKTMEEFTEGSPRVFSKPPGNPREPFFGNRNDRRVAVVIDPLGKLHYGQGHADGDHVIAILSHEVPDEYLAELRHDGVSFFFAALGPDAGASVRQEQLCAAMDILGGTFGIKTLFLQGGGITNGLFLKAGLIDEYSLLIYPGIDGLAGIPTSFEYPGQPGELPAAGQALRHLETQILEGGVVWSRYRSESVSPGIPSGISP